MATSLGYTPPPPPDTAARDDLDDLVRALHESGLLRALAGGARSYPVLLSQLLRTVDASTVRSAIALAGALRDARPEQAERLAAGLRDARHAAGEVAAAPAEGPLGLLRRLRDPDTRRGISAALAAVAAVGASLGPADRD
ncbi:DUF1641 domain-containing protein [Nocardioides sp.]|jgi:uncharacterized protein YjgD (DUF1641 family)|uniref:DUF1641 domain-containing protein n=1 Tax=Nocardioides sp. TaxID=35761 RepID=UPI0026330CDD|nr:DUF1641 domain-containing protein [Nocardioides sp.]